MLGIALRPVRKGIREGCLEVTVRKEVRADTDRDGQSGVKTRDGQRTRKLSLEATPFGGHGAEPLQYWCLPWVPMRGSHAVPG